MLFDVVGELVERRVDLGFIEKRRRPPADALQRAPLQTAGDDYFHAARRFTVDVPVGEVKVTAVRGIEYVPVEKKVSIRSGETPRATSSVRNAWLTVRTRRAARSDQRSSWL